jgi:Arc/MetJ family transcription regulator
MRITINVDEELVARAQKLTGTMGRTEIIHEGLRALIARESARRLARLGAIDRRAKVPHRHRAS